MDPNTREVPESMKLAGPANYIIWSYKVKLLLMQEGLWKFIEPANSDQTGAASSDQSGSVTNGPAPEGRTPANIEKEAEQRFRAGRLIISTVRDSIILSVIHLTDPQDIWRRLKNMCDVKNSSRRLSLKEQFYTLRLSEGKAVGEHLQQVNLIVTQLANLGIATSDEDLVDQTLNSLPKSWATFRQIQKGRDHPPSFPELEGLLLQEELSRKIDQQRDEAEEVNFVRNGRPPLRGQQLPGRG